MAPNRAHLRLGNSWVVEGEDDSPEDQNEENDPEYVAPFPPSPSDRRRTTRRTTTSPEPQLVMPSIDMNNMDGSWTDTRRTHSPKTHRAVERPRVGHQRRSGRAESSSSPEKAAGPGKPRRSPPQNPVAGQDLSQVVFDHLESMFSWSVDVLGRALRILKAPISYLLAIWMLFGLAVIARNLITTSIYASLSPICRFPGTSMLNLPFCPAYLSNDADDIPPVEFDQLMAVQSKFEDVLVESAGSVTLPMDMKRGEASVRDLRQLVQFSQIDSKNELLWEFDGFVETARTASYDLMRFNSHVGRGVDIVLSTTRWTTRMLEGIQMRDASRGAISSFFNDKLLAVFQPVRYTESALLDQYIRHTEVVEEEINRLIVEAQALLLILASLEDRLEVIHGIVIKDKQYARAKKDEILSELWTMVGGNRGKLKKMDKQLNLLQHVAVYRKSAYAHVSGTILKLQAIGAGLEDLRQRVGSPQVLRDRIDIPLSVHIENIQRGVERLEELRVTTKNTENERIRQTLERGGMDVSLIES